MDKIGLDGEILGTAAVTKSEYSAESMLIELEGDTRHFGGPCALWFNDNRGISVEIIFIDEFYSDVPVLTLEVFKTLHKDIVELMLSYFKNTDDIYPLYLSGKHQLLNEVGKVVPYFDNDECYQVEADELKRIINAYELDKQLVHNKPDTRRRNLKI